MRRPLCAAALLITVAVSLILFFFPHSAVSSFSQLDNEEVVLRGKVIDKQYRLSSDTGKLSLLITLGDYGIETEWSVDDGIVQVGNIGDDSTVQAGNIGDDGIVQIRNSRNILVRIPVDGNDASLKDSSMLCREDSLSAIGSKIKVRGTLRCFQKPTNHGEFDQSLYYEVQDYDFELRSSKLLACSKDKDIVRDSLYLVRRRISLCIDRCFSDADDAAIIKAMLIGEKGFISGDIKDLYQESGVIHILAISGLHISLLGMGLFSFLKKRNIRTPVCVAVSSFVIILYAMMTGISVSAFRAFFSFFIHMGAYLLHRTYDLLSAMSLCAVILIISQPLYLLYSGFLFSFAAVTAIGAVIPILPERLEKEGIFRYIRPKSLAVPSGALPVYLCFYGSFPVYSVFLNLFVLPMMSVLMLSGIIAVSAGLVFAWAGAALSIVPHIILTAYKALCVLSASLPFHLEVIGHPYYWTVIIYMVIMLALIVFEEFIPDLIKILIMFSAMMFLTFHFSNGLQIHAADVGQGDGILIMSDGLNITIDGGSTSKSDIAKYTLEPMLTYYGIACIDYAFITHDDEDHVNGIKEIIREGNEKGIYVKHIVLPDIEDSENSGDGGLEEIKALADKKGIPILYFGRGDTLKHGRLKITCLNPVRGKVYDSGNEGSQVLFLEYGSFTALFTGDIEGEPENDCLSYMKNEGILSGGLTLLKVAHHGSSGSSDGNFLSYVKPQYSVISCGINNRYGHPHKETLERLDEVGSKVRDTRFMGEITIKTNGRTMSIAGYSRQ